MPRLYPVGFFFILRHNKLYGCAQRCYKLKAEMELKPTSNQNLVSVAQPYIERSESHPHYRKYDEMRIKLIRHLEQNVDGPPQWVTVSESRGCFYITEEDTYEPCNARVEIYQIAEFYEIRYRMPDDLAPWRGVFGTWVLGETTDVEEAGRMVVIALERAARNLPRNRTEWHERYGSS